MRLKLVEINGFKSFPDKVSISFDEGLIAIVGPNGSGKSNVVDAVRWVLGEQSSKTLRGGKMEDVIFSGTQHRKAVGMAEVSLVLDNADGALPTPLTEVRVTRRLYRSGESEYLLAGRPVRLKDIHELFMNTGIGRDGYSLIGQGKIAEVLSSRSEDRRAMFEEAAGISKYRYRRTESLRRLEAAESNLVRLRDILQGYATRVGPLRTQSEKARRYLDMRQERRGLEINVWLERLEQTKDLISKSADDCEIVTAQLEELAQRQQQFEQETASLDLQVQEVTVQMDDVLRSQRELEQRMAQTRSDAAVMENELRHNRERQDAVKKGMENSQERRQALLDRQAAAQAKGAELAAHREELQARLALLTERATGGLLEQTQQRMAQLRMEQLDLGDALGRCRAEVANAEAAGSAQGENEARAQAELGAQEQAVQQAQRQAEQAESGRSEKQELLLRAQNALGGYEKKLATRREKEEAAQQAHRQAQERRTQAEQRLRALEDLEKSREGFSGAVKLVLQEAEHGRLPGVHGALSSLIETGQETALAIETALGAAMQHIVVDNEQQAKRAIFLLKSRNAGRATFLPLSAVQPRQGDRLPREGEGIVGVASELVSCEEAYRALLSSLLGRTLVTRDIDSAIAVAKRHGYRFRIVTLDGQMVNAGGSLTGGSQVRGAGMLTRRNEIEALTQQVRQLEQEEQAAGRQVQQCAEERRRVEAEMQGGLSELQTAREQHIKSEAECESTKAALGLLLSGCEAMRERQEQARRAREEALALLKKAQEEQTALLLRQSVLEGELAALEAEHSQQAQKVAGEMQEISDCRMALTAAQRDEQALLEACRQTRELLDLQDTDCGQLKEELSALVRQEGELVQSIQAALEGEKGSGLEAEALVRSTEQLTQQREQAESRRSALRLEEKELSQQRENLVREQERCEAQRAQVQSEHDGIVASLWDEYELTVSGAKELRTPMESAAAARRRIAQLKQDMKALGHVNVDAIEEYKQVKQQFDFYSAQVEDLEVSKKELEGMISDLTKEMQGIFSRQFEVINRHFGQTFADLFGGGKAMLSLDDPSDVLESGIELRVQPPGKVINNLSALSGGEQALTAIALYFAILQVRPSPFVILDEIDTALDEVNVVRLANYYKRFTQKTQLILITHRRGAMEAADVLYGITMQERGVSKLLKIDVNDVERQINLRAT